MLARSFVCLAVLATYASAAAIPLQPRKTQSEQNNDEEPAKPTKVPMIWRVPASRNFKDSKPMAFLDFPKLQSLSVYSAAGDTSVWGISTGKTGGATVTIKQNVKYDDNSLEQTVKVVDSEGNKLQKDVLKCDIDEDTGKASCVLRQKIKTVSDGDNLKFTATDLKMQTTNLMATPAPGNGAMDAFEGTSSGGKSETGSHGAAYSSW